MARTSSKALIIDTAEQLMAREGIDHVSIRRVNEATGLSPAAVHYHFKNKSELLSAVLLKHLRPESERNHAKLHLLGNPEFLNANSFIEAMLAPLSTILLEDGLSGEYFAQLSAQIYAHKRQQFSDSIPPEFLDMAELDFELFKLLKPSIPEHRLKLQFRFLSLCIVEAAANIRESLGSESMETLTEEQVLLAKREYLQELHAFLSRALQ